MEDPTIHECLERIVEWLGIPWSGEQTHALVRYSEWLGDEGLALGGIGPHERDRLWPRHVCDSLAFGRGIKTGATVLDVGTGVGLPGIPLAIAFPATSFVLLDRSGRRVDALRRVRRLLGITPTVVCDDVGGWTDPVDRIVFRASLRVEPALAVAKRLLSDGGEAWFGLGRGERPQALAAWEEVGIEVPADLAVETVCVPGGILDSPAWLLRITVP